MLDLECVQALGSVPPLELEEHMWMFRRFYNFGGNRVRLAGVAQQWIDKHQGQFAPIRRQLEERAFRQRKAKDGE